MDKNNLFVYHTTTGATLAGEEIEAAEDKKVITVRGISTVEMNSALSQITFTPLRYADPKEPYSLFTTGLLGTQKMPEMFRKPFQEFLEDICS